MQQYLLAALKVSSHHEVIDVISNGQVAIDQAIALKPDIILLDLFLLEVDGIDVIRHVMHHAPCPIVVISGELDRADRDLTFEAQRAGAVSVLAKPFGMEASEFDAFSENLSHIVDLMSQVKVTRRWLRYDTAIAEHPVQVAQSFLKLDFDLLVIGSSAGGPAALYKILEAIGPNFPFPILISQHIAEGFSDTLCDWLGKTGCHVKSPENGELMQAGTVYVSPDSKHMVLGQDNRLEIITDTKVLFTPNIDLLFESVALNYHKKVCALILTGMGSDGTSGMSKLYKHGALTIAEAESSCVIFGMPKMAINAGVVRMILSLDEIASAMKNSFARAN